MKFQEEQGSKDPYEHCPAYENDRFLLRLVSMDDAQSLLPCYSRPTDSVTANAFNCTYGYGSQTVEEMRDVIRMWLEAYRARGYVRWSVVDKRVGTAVGTIELCKRQIADACNGWGILRLDLGGAYERGAEIWEILSLLLADLITMFDCTVIVTKAIPAAGERIAALGRLGFARRDAEGALYDGFWMLER